MHVSPSCVEVDRVDPHADAGLERLVAHLHLVAACEDHGFGTPRDELASDGEADLRPTTEDDDRPGVTFRLTRGAPPPFLQGSVCLNDGWT